MVKSDSESQTAHLLFEFIENGEVTIDSVVLGDQLEEWDSNITKDNIITLVKDLIVDNGMV